METPISTIVKNNVQTNHIDDNLLAGLYASGMIDLNDIDYNIFDSIVQKKKMLIDIKLENEEKYKTVVISVIQSVLKNQKNKILLLTSSHEEEINYINYFKKISLYIDHVNQCSIDDINSDTNIIIGHVSKIEKIKDYSEIDYVVVDNCISKDLMEIEPLLNIEKIILCNQDNESLLSLVSNYPTSKTVTFSEKEEYEPETIVNDEIIEENKSVVVHESKHEVVEESKHEVVEESKPVVVEESKHEVVEESKHEESKPIVVEESKPVVVQEKSNIDSKKIKRNVLLKLRRV